MSKFDVFGFGDERASKVADVMGSKTAKKILDFLKNEEGSETEISKKLNIALPTVHYNIKKLVDAGLVEVKRTMWSSKGNKINYYKATNKVLVVSHTKPRNVETKLAMIFPLVLIGALIVGILAYVYVMAYDNGPVVDDDGLMRFNSDKELLDALEEAQKSGSGWFAKGGVMFAEEADVATAGGTAVTEAMPGSGGDDYSETNVQVEGVDEADIVKTDGKYIYVITGSKLVITKAYPAENAEILSKTEFDDFRPNEMFIDGNRLLVFGRERYKSRDSNGDSYGTPINSMNVRLYNVRNKEDIELLREVSFEGSYVTARKIGTDVYFVVNSYPYLYEDVVCSEVVPKYADSGDLVDENDFEPIVGCADVGYVPDVEVQNFLTVASISMDDEDAEIKKEVILGNGQNVYASTENLYIAQTKIDRGVLGGQVEDSEKTIITKFALDDGKIEYKGIGEVKGHILNQFSMDEYGRNFRIATTISGYVDNVDTSVNNIYVLDEKMEVIGSVEDVAPGESIYSIRFMGKRAYMVTFRHIDPLFVIDLSNPENPEILGKLKIPGYSDYLHPYDETHLIGIGKEVDASIDADKIHTEGAVYYTAIQGVKISIFDVSDVENPIEMHKVVIGDRGTESLATSEHKAFLFDKEKNLLVVPMVVAELAEGQDKSEQGEFVFSGAYVYDINLEDGFDLKGRITHYDNDEVFEKSGYYFYGGSENVRRSLYIGNVLYTISDAKIKMNDLDSLDEIKELVFNNSVDDSPAQMIDEGVVI